MCVCVCVLNILYVVVYVVCVFECCVREVVPYVESGCVFDWGPYPDGFITYPLGPFLSLIYLIIRVGWHEIHQVSEQVCLKNAEASAAL